MSDPIEIDPVHHGRTARWIFLAEGLANLGGLLFVFTPREVLKDILERPAEINTSSIFLTRLWGSWISGALVLPLFYIYPNTRAAINARPKVYMGFLVADIAFLGVLAADMMSSKPALKRDAAGGIAALMLPLLGWRWYCVFQRPELLGRYRPKKKE